MFNIAVSFATSADMLLFKDEERAKAAFAAIKGPPPEQTMVGFHPSKIEITDDFGKTLLVKIDSITAVSMEDMSQSQLAHIERALHQARMQAKGSEAAQNDSVLRAAAARQGPSIINPGIPGNGYGRM